MRKIRSLKEINQRIHQLEIEERSERQVLKESTPSVRQTSSNIELAFYIGKIAAEVFKIWRKPNQSKKSRWKNIIISIVMIVGIQLAQQYLDKRFNPSDKD